MKGFNHFTLRGYVAQNPTLKTLSEGLTLCNAVVVVVEPVKDADSGEWREKESEFDITFFGETADSFVKEVSIGCAVIITGKIKCDQIKGKDGNVYPKLRMTGASYDVIGHMEDTIEKASSPVRHTAAKPASPEKVAAATAPEDIPF